MNIKKNKYSDIATSWIFKKLKQGVDPMALLNGVGIFSNKHKKKVMAEKGLNALQYDDRYNFLAEVYTQLSSGSYIQNKTASNNGQAFYKNNVNYNQNFSKAYNETNANTRNYVNRYNGNYYGKREKVPLPHWLPQYEKELEEKLARMRAEQAKEEAEFEAMTDEEKEEFWNMVRETFGGK